jgi:hypothetical protein
MTGEFLTTLDVREGDGERWTLMAPLIYVDENGRRFVVPTGTPTDFASIPRAFWMLYPKSGKHNKAAVVHDWLCQTKLVDSASAHAVFKRALKACGVNRLNRQVMWAMVRAFGPRFEAHAVTA